jgi:anti-anti-sigma factor
MAAQEVVTKGIRNGVTILNLFGDVTPMSERPVLALYEQETQAGAKKILLNFSNAKYINSGGIAIIISMVSEGRKNDQQIGVCSLTPHFQKIFEMIGLLDYVALYQNEEEAIRTMS